MKSVQLRLVLVLLLFAGTLSAQQAKINRVKNMMKNLDYIGAVSVLNQVLASNDNSEAKILIADCYRHIGDSENGEYWYGQVVRLAEAQPVHNLHYGMMLQQNGKCDLAQEWYTKYTSLVPDDVRGQFLDRACSYEQELKTKNAGIFEIEHCNFNSAYDDFGSALYKDKQLIFASERDFGAAVKREHSWTGYPFLELYAVDYTKSGEVVTFGAPEKYKKLNTKFHDAVVSFSRDMQTVFYTRNNMQGSKIGTDDEGIIRLKVYSSQAKGESAWSGEESLPFNSDEYSVTHPSLSADGTKLYFSSDMPGGYGGFDIYVSEYESGRWSPPVNVGPKLNTEGHEAFPYIHLSGRLYFASDGHVGMGGLDIYSSESDNGAWTNPTNIGAPVNSSSDDFGIFVNDEGNYGYFTSDRTGGDGRDDIYSFKKTAVAAEIYVFDAVTLKPIEDALVIDTCTGRELRTGTNGKAYSDIKFNACCDFKASKAEYDPNTKQACGTMGVDRVLVEIPLMREMKFDLRGIVFDLGTGLPMDGANVTLTSDCGAETTSFTTGADGRFNFANLRKDCCYSVKGDKAGYLAQMVDSVCTRGLTTSTTLNKTLNLQASNVIAANPSQTNPALTNPVKPGQPATPQSQSVAGMVRDPETGLYMNPTTKNPANGTFNGITFKGGSIVSTGGNTIFEAGPSGVSQNGEVSYLVHIYYDFDQSYIRGESKPELDKLLKMMKANPQTYIELSSHTDARGSNNYNNRLSQRRAEAVVRWLAARGIERERLVARGQGEAQHVNGCNDNIPCSEREHQMNRRTEFKVLGCRDCPDPKAIISSPNESTKVDPCQGCPF